MNFKLDIINILILIVMLVNSVYGLIVYSRNRADKINFSFFILTISITMWGLSMAAYRGILDHDSVVWMARLLYFSAITIPTAFIYFCFVFPDPNKKLNTYQKYLTPIPMIILCIASLIPGWFINDVILYSGKESFIVFNKIAEISFIIYVSSYFTWAYFIIIKKYLKATGVLKIQFAYIFIGTFSSTIITLITNMTLLYLGDFDFNWVGQVGIIVMITLIFYSILKYRLFNIRVIATELFVFALWTFILVRTFLSDNLQDQLVDISLFLVTLIVGILLIRSVTKEVRLREKIESQAKQLDSLVHLVSHEVKGALGKNRDAFAAIREGDLGEVPEPVRKIAEAADESTKNTVEMVMDILNSSSAKNGSLAMYKKPFDLKVATEEVVNALVAEAQAKNLELKLEIPDGADYTVNGDREKIIQHVIRNLVDNSIRYTPSGSVTVGLSGGIKPGMTAKEKVTAKVLFFVRDTGVGITPEDMSHLFTEGGRGKDSVKVNVHSTGYGLFFARSITDAHGGRVWAESQGAGKGSQFYMELPAFVEESKDKVLTA